MASVLVIDDDPKFCDVLSQLIREMGHHLRWVHTLREGLKEAAQGENDVVFLDVRLPDGNGLEALPRIRQMPGTPEVIIMTGEGDPDGAELAIKSGAWDYLEKPSSLEAMALPFLRALQYREEKKARSPRVALRLEGIAGQSRKMKASFDLVAQAASSDASVLITGETGTGKELFAWAIHQNSRRSGKSFVVVDCAALPETLVESILFGHEKGAFTGADRVREGLIQQADGGTLFLDEVGELPLTVQGAFLRVLQDHRFRPLGGRREVGSDFRVVAATNQNLNTMVDQGLFRKDLLFRLRSLTIELPPPPGTKRRLGPDCHSSHCQILREGRPRDQRVFPRLPRNPAGLRLARKRSGIHQCPGTILGRRQGRRDSICEASAELYPHKYGPLFPKAEKGVRRGEPNPGRSPFEKGVPRLHSPGPGKSPPWR